MITSEEIRVPVRDGVSILKTLDSCAGQILIDCPMKRDQKDPGYLILLKGECNECPFNEGILKEGPEGFDVSQNPFSENVIADEIYAPQHIVLCAYKNEGEKSV